MISEGRTCGVGVVALLNHVGCSSCRICACRSTIVSDDMPPQRKEKHNARTSQNTVGAARGTQSGTILQIVTNTIEHYTFGPKVPMCGATAEQFAEIVLLKN